MPVGRDQLRPMQRLVRIMAVLDQAGSGGATSKRLTDVADYGEGDPVTQLGQDLNHLRKQGWQIDSVGGKGEGGRYRMVPGDNRLRLKLTNEQLAALQRAVILADRADLAQRLGVNEASLPPGIGTQVVAKSADPQLSKALDAVQSGCRVSFSYKGTPRVVSPGTVRFQNYRWYLSGVEDGGDIVKHFVVGRMSDLKVGKPGSADAVAQVQRIPLHPLQWRIDDATEVRVSTHGDYVPDVVRWLQEPDAARSIDGGQVEMTYTVTNRAAFRARIYVLGARISVVGPENFRAEMLAELRSLAAR